MRCASVRSLCTYGQIDSLVVLLERGVAWLMFAREVVRSKKESLDFNKFSLLSMICLNSHQCQRAQARIAKKNAPKVSVNKFRTGGCPAGFKWSWGHGFEIDCGLLRLLSTH